MKDNLPVRRATPSAILDAILVHILRGESPMDTRVAAHKASLFTLTTEEKNFDLHELGQYLFLVLAEHNEDMLFLEELCGIASSGSDKYHLNYAEFFYKLDNKQEIEFLAEASSLDHRITRFKLLAVLDALFSIAKLSVVQTWSKDSKIDLNGYTFIETSLLLRDLSIIYYSDKLREKPRFVRKDGVYDERFSRFSSERKEVPKSIFIKFTGNMRDEFARRTRDAIMEQERALNIRYHGIMESLFKKQEVYREKERKEYEKNKEARSAMARKGGKEKEYISNMATAIFNFISVTPCGNQEKFRHLFGGVYNNENPYKIGKNEYFIDSESYEFCRKYTDFTKHEREEVVPQSSFTKAFKRALKRLLKEA